MKGPAEKGAHRNWFLRKTQEKRDRMKERGEHVQARGGGGDRRACWCGLYHHRVLTINKSLPVGIVFAWGGRR